MDDKTILFMGHKQAVYFEARKNQISNWPIDTHNHTMTVSDHE